MGKWESWSENKRATLCTPNTFVVGLLNLLVHKLIFKYAYEFYRSTIPNQTIDFAMHIYQPLAPLNGLLYAGTLRLSHKLTLTVNESPVSVGWCERGSYTWEPRVWPHQSNPQPKPKIRVRVGESPALCLRLWLFGLTSLNTQTAGSQLYSGQGWRSEMQELLLLMCYDHKIKLEVCVWLVIGHVIGTCDGRGFVDLCRNCSELLWVAAVDQSSDVYLRVCDCLCAWLF